MKTAVSSLACCTLLGLALGARPAAAQPVITQHPQALAVAAGLGATLQAAASGTPAPTYQWRKDGTDLPGATSAVLHLPVVAVAAAGNYSVVATNTGGSAASAAAALVVSPTPVILSDQWTARASGTVLPLSGAGWNGSQFVAIGGSGAILTSADGSTWTTRTSGTASALAAVAWSGSQFVIVGAAGTVLTSPDGLTWTDRTSGVTDALAGVVWSGSQFVVAGGSGTILTSPDGNAWTVRTSGTANALAAVAWSGSRFVAVGGGGTILTSADGSTWTASTSGTANALAAVAWSGSQFVAVGAAGTVLTSPDGLTWTTRTSGTPNALSSLTWTGDQLVVVGDSGTILTSPDGIAWTGRTSGTAAALAGVVWSGSELVSVGTAGAILATGSPPAGPRVANIAVARRAGTTLVDITYDLIHPLGLACTIAVAVSPDGGATWLGAPLTLTGAAGTGITPGTGKVVTWDAGADWSAARFTATRVRVLADDRLGSMVLIPAGTFAMGDSKGGEAYSYELPVHSVTLSAFYLWKTELTYAQWQEVYAWNQAGSHGYDFSTGAGKAANHPVHDVNWYDALKWCNAKSRMEGLTPCYYTDAGLTAELKTGEINQAGTDLFVDWSANGYRLPTEAEWEYACRGGATDGRRFPWGDTITHGQANYYVYSQNGTTNYYSYDVSPTREFHPSYNDEVFPYTAPAGSFPPNAFGLHDMVGNVLEWCWDVLGNFTSDAQTNPHGPAGSAGLTPVIRGGSWINNAIDARSARRFGGNPLDSYDGLGFRPARSSIP